MRVIAFSYFVVIVADGRLNLTAQKV
ncbi:hypothetical protein MES4922_300048 [Mesorhizobium ventifaucium]|uniref:LysR family transcriptional regulator n=1 Tax=Mesorhizobium ventifaucium TaxID=666020 RepID=A0ABM9E133_9HYPH|nr:hypothetical protein MES4922_300048 [Mesorhizobium ventifaucium]